MTGPKLSAPEGDSTFECSSERIGDQVTLYLAGDIDLAAVEPMMAAGRAALQDRQVLRVCVDCKAVTFVDSTGLNMIVQWQRVALQGGKALTLRGVPRTMAKLLALTGLDQVVDIADRAEPPIPVTRPLA